VNNREFQYHYKGSDKTLNDILSNEYYFDDTHVFSHLEKTLLVTALAYEDPDDIKDLWLVLGESLNVPKFNLLITSSFMSQQLLNNLLKRTDARTIDNIKDLIEEYGFTVPSEVVIPENVWQQILGYGSGRDLSQMQLVSREAKNITSSVVLSNQQLLRLIEDDDLNSLYANRKSITLNNVLLLVQETVYHENFNILKLLIKTAMEMFGFNYEEKYMFEREVLKLILRHGTEEMIHWLSKEFDAYIFSKEKPLSSLFRRLNDSYLALAEYEEEMRKRSVYGIPGSSAKTMRNIKDLWNSIRSYAL
jgi:hypothetical protein